MKLHSTLCSDPECSNCKALARDRADAFVLGYRAGRSSTPSAGTIALERLDVSEEAYMSAMREAVADPA